MRGAFISLPAVFLLVMPGLSACKKDETISAFVAPDSIWQLSELHGQPFTASASITFPKPGEITGQAPCNSYTAHQTAPYPWFEAVNITSTRMACAGLAQEQAFFSALSQVTIAEVSGSILILSTETSPTMVFTSR